MLYHIGGPGACKLPALGVKRSLSAYEIAAENVVRLDGTTPQRGEAIVCGSCKAIIREVGHLRSFSRVVGV